MLRGQQPVDGVARKPWKRMIYSTELGKPLREWNGLSWLVEHGCERQYLSEIEMRTHVGSRWEHLVSRGGQEKSAQLTRVSKLVGRCYPSDWHGKQSGRLFG